MHATRQGLSAQRRLVLGAVIVSAALSALSLADPSGLRRLQRLRADVARQEDKNRALREENARLSRAVKELSPPVNPAVLERLAREQLGFVRQDEVLFKFE